MSKNQVYFDESALQVVQEVYDIGSGTVVVDELPETGEEHTVYELHQTVQGDFPWLLTMFDRNSVYPHPKFSVIVVETEEQVTQEYLAFPSEYNLMIVVFVKNTNNVYECYVEAGEQEDTFVKEIVLPEVDNTYLIIKQRLAILKDFDYQDGTGHFLDGTEFNYEGGRGIVPLVLTEAKNPMGLLSSNLIGVTNCKDINDTSELPTAKQAVDGNMCNSDGFVDYPIYITLQNKLGYENETSTDTYSWNSEFQYFVNLEVEDVPENPAHYYGPLEWNQDPISVINKIDASLLDIGRVIPVFNPQPAHTEVSYWIYTNDEWMNIDEINNNPSLHKTVFGTLTHTDGEVELQCSLTLEEMASAIDQGSFVVLELNMGDESRENYYYCAVGDVTVGEEGPDSVDIFATWSFARGLIEWNPSIGAFVFNNGIM